MVIRRVAFLVLVLMTVACGDDSSPPASCTGLCTPPSLHVLDLVAGQPGGPGHVDGTLLAAHLDGPWNVASDGAGHLYVTDDNMIRAVDLAAQRVTTIAGAYG